MTVASSGENAFVRDVIGGNTAWIGAKGGGNIERASVIYQWKWTGRISGDSVFKNI